MKTAIIIFLVFAAALAAFTLVTSVIGLILGEKNDSAGKDK